MLHKFSLTLAAALLSCAAQSHARTLFIDLNNAPTEIAVARAAYGKNGKTDVVVIPSFERISVQQRQKIELANTTLEKATEEAQNCAADGKKTRACETVYDRIRNAELERVKQTGNYGLTDLESDLANLSNSPEGVPFDTIVISGHHEHGYFAGQIFEVQIPQLAAMVQRNSHLFSSAKTVVLLGCSTGTREMFSNAVGPMFPSAPIIIGSEDRAPIKTEQRNLNFFSKVMSDRKLLLSSQSPSQARSVFNTYLQMAWPASMLWHHQTAFYKDTTEPLKIAAFSQLPKTALAASTSPSLPADTEQPQRLAPISTPYLSPYSNSHSTNDNTINNSNAYPYPLPTSSVRPSNGAGQDMAPR